MTEVILNDECMHCNDKECHDGEHFCNQAMKKNSFYKNAELYRGLEVIHRPTYAELKEENAELKEQNRNLLESCEGATMMYKDLCKAKELLNMFLRLHYNPIVDEHTLFCKVKQFLSEVENERENKDDNC